MQEFIDWFSEYDNLILFVQVFVAGVTAVATIVLAFVTWNLARVSKRAPFVVCSLGHSQTVQESLHAFIINTGNATAFDIEVHFEADRVSPTDKKELKLNFSLLTPGQVLHPHSNLEGWETKTKIYLTITWALKPNGRRQKPLKYIIDDSDENKGGLSENELRNITNQLMEIGRILSSMEMTEARRNNG